MQRSRQSIASLCAALANAQAELVNPEKSLVAIIRPDGPRGAEQAPLSSGLDIVRKTPGQYEIATEQTTGQSDRWNRQSHDRISKCLRGMDRLGLASIRPAKTLLRTRWATPPTYARRFGQQYPSCLPRPRCMPLRIQKSLRCEVPTRSDEAARLCD